MLRSEKAQVDVGGAIRVAFTLDPEAQHRPSFEGRYVPPDPFAGVIGLPGVASEVASETTDVDFEFVRDEGGEAREESGEG